MLKYLHRPDLVVEITMQPVRRYGVDAAIFFSDIVLPLKAIGVDLDIKPGVGPVVADPVHAEGRRPDTRITEHVPFVGGGAGSGQRARGNAADRIRRRPFTVASYLVEAGRPRSMRGPRR